MSKSTLVTPFWFPQRQCQAEALSDDFYRITGPNMPTTFLGIRQLDNGKYQGYFRRAEDNADDAITEPDFDKPQNAWEAVFELYRQQMIL